jgi:hydrogenase expression/formation protein HypC
MCLTVPGKVVALEGTDPAARQARVDFGGTVRSVSLLYAPEAEIGSYVIVHAGFATAVIPEAEALEALGYARELATAASLEAREASTP